MLEENSVTTANGGLPFTEWVPCKADSWSGIEKMTSGASSGYSSGAALHHAVERVAPDSAVRVEERLPRHVFRRIKVVGQVIILVHRAKQTDSHPEIERKLRRYTPIVL